MQLGWTLILWCLVASATGCSTLRTTEPGRTATEQFLLSQAAQRSIEMLSTRPVRDRLVYLDTTYLIGDKYPKEENLFLAGELRARLLESGTRLTDDRAEAQIIMEVRSLGVGIDRVDALVGVPSLHVPAAGGSTSVVTPEIAIVKRLRQRGYASIAYVAYWREGGEIVASSGPFLGRTEREDFWILGFGPQTWGTISPAKE